MKKLIINCETGEQTEVELTADEIAQREADEIAYKEKRLAYEELAAEKATNRQSAIAKLSGLGLSADEVAALLN
jgi:DNA-binding NarL/FixJ family response regulator